MHTFAEIMHFVDQTLK